MADHNSAHAISVNCVCVCVCVCCACCELHAVCVVHAVCLRGCIHTCQAKLMQCIFSSGGVVQLCVQSYVIYQLFFD